MAVMNTTTAANQICKYAKIIGISRGGAPIARNSGPARSLDDEFADLQQDHGIANELAAMKARLATKEG